MKPSFTLIESLIYLALFALVIGGILISTYQTIEGTERTNSNIVVQEEANFLLRKIDWALTNISSISNPSAGNTSSVLSVTKTDLPLSDNPLTFDTNSSSLRLTRGSFAPTPLSSVNVSITNVVFEHIASTGTKPAAIKASFKINDKPFSTVKYLRK